MTYLERLTNMLDHYETDLELWEKTRANTVKEGRMPVMEDFNITRVQMRIAELEKLIMKVET